MSIFGKLDAENVPSNPFWVAKGEYESEITDAKFGTNRDNQRQLIIEFTINDKESQFIDQKVKKYFDLVDVDFDTDKFELLPPEEQKRTRIRISSLKNALCGNGKNKGLGVDPSELNDEHWNPETLKGIQCDIAISNYGTNNEGVNVRWANIRD